jgi:hypothetical protein
MGYKEGDGIEEKHVNIYPSSNALVIRRGRG